MKIIALMPVKNEEWIIDHTLSALSQFCDHIVVADQFSTDRTREICKNYSKVIIINNNSTSGHSNRIRWELLDVARNFDGNNLILCVDADEIIPPKLFLGALPSLCEKKNEGKWVEFHWVQLWKSIRFYRNDDSIWSDIWKPVGWIDDRKLAYENKVVINDHTLRIPGKETNPKIRLDTTPLLHFQWVPWEKVQVKQAWYRCSELIKSPKTPYIINEKYKHSLDDDSERLSPVPKQWLDGLNLSDSIKLTEPGWQYNQVEEWFRKFGIDFFEPLQIWHIEAFHKQFVKTEGREPIAKTEPPFGYHTKEMLRSYLLSLEHRAIMATKKCLGLKK